jgi:methyl-accepting chemotaxis protein
MACAAVPIRDSDGKILGTIVAGYDLSKNELVDGVKRLFGTDVTLFGGDVRYSTTIVADGKRATGTRLAAPVADAVLKRKEEFRGRTGILGVPFLTSYRPMLSPSGEVIGACFAGKSLVGVFDATKTFVIFLSIVMGISVGFFLVVTFLFARKISRPLKLLVEVIRHVEDGDLSVSGGGISTGSGDEIEILAAALAKMVETQRSTIESARASAVETEEKARGLSELSGRTTAAMERIERQVGRLADLAANNAAALQQSGAGVHKIVADEVRKLAEESDRAAGQVDRIVGELKNSANTALASMHEVDAIVDGTIRKAGDAGRQLDPALQEITRISDEIHNIAASAEEQAAASEQATEGLDSVTRALEEEVHSVETIRGAASEATVASRTTDDESRAMQRDARGLLEVLARFRTTAGESDRLMPT